ncbi:uncharacterized protein MELLADRAFT_70249 [Melampsora larici-populina 98AG31]|uniref:Uncharacterized protein n=1 Tax=Melampsora larici-populina (strain 98AG31 / pathotype 3-4-7) TaxID=747676 RepID=F4SE74_MELLP|nr:uncharacterized protein MELLADRAFT_70249 [Melampsora larici-populina 98AG31]EGF97052.1 hypothetical protein MELLADRAFT_70249 [Melampsora larici-populina 98AG31]
MEVENAPDTGQKEHDTQRVQTPTRDASNAFINPVGPQEAIRTNNPSTPLTFDKESLSQGLTQSPSILVSDLGNFSKKRSRLDSAGVTAENQATELTGTPRSNRISHLCPGTSESKSLKEIVSKLLEVVKAGFPLANKAKTTKKITVDVETAADILVLTGAVYDQVMYEDARRNFTTPAALMGPNQKSRSIIFKGKETEDKLDAILEILSLQATLTAKQTAQQQKKGPPTQSYALAASKHAPSNNGHTTAGKSTPQAKTQSQRQTPKAKSTNAITLVHEPGANITHPTLSNAKLIHELNTTFRAYQIKMKPEDESTIEIKSHTQLKSELYRVLGYKVSLKHYL